jgi:predicted SAM-dependent methyltransferase
MKLNLGCGDNYLAGFINVDKYAKKVDIRCDALFLPFKNESFDLIYLGHVIEHFSKNNVKKLLREMYRILKQEGKLVIDTPDFDKLVRAYTRGGIVKKLLDVPYYRLLSSNIFSKISILRYVKSIYNRIFITDEDLIASIFGEDRLGMRHFYIFNFRIIKIFLKETGFVEVYKLPRPPEFSKHFHRFNMTVVAYKK